MQLLGCEYSLPTLGESDSPLVCEFSLPNRDECAPDLGNLTGATTEL